MKKALFLVAAGLTMLSVSTFGAGLFERRSGETDQAWVAEVPEGDIEARFNPAVAGRRAEGNPYALLATDFSPATEKLPPPYYAISGVKGQEILEPVGGKAREAVDIVVDLPQNESFVRGLIEGTDVSSWIVNLPRGLEARAHALRRNAKSIRIYVSGTPEVTARAIVSVNIPGNYLKGGVDLRYDSPSADESYNSWREKQTQSEEE
jgi:hypothetical protein